MNGIMQWMVDFGSHVSVIASGNLAFWFSAILLCGVAIGIHFLRAKNR